MRTKRKQPLASGTAITAAICLTLASLLVTGCGDSSSDSTSSSAKEETEVGVVLRANPNPVPGGTERGKTTISWQTGSASEADIFFVDSGNETLFASGSKGSKEADFIRPGANEFRFYNKGEHKLVTQLMVTMPIASGSGNGTPAPAAPESK